MLITFSLLKLMPASQPNGVVSLKRLTILFIANAANYWSIGSELHRNSCHREVCRNDHFPEGSCTYVQNAIPPRYLLKLRLTCV